jgi:hypothetical protein
MTERAKRDARVIERCAEALRGGRAKWSTSSRANSCATENPTNDKAAAELGVRALVRTLEYPHEESVATHDCKIVGSGKVTDGL